MPVGKVGMANNLLLINNLLNQLSLRLDYFGYTSCGRKIPKQIIIIIIIIYYYYHYYFSTEKSVVKKASETEKTNEQLLSVDEEDLLVNNHIRSFLVICTVLG